MEQSRLNLRWNNHTETFVNKLEQFRVQELYCDATIACDGRVYPVHKVVLSACSDFFASIFASTRCQNPVVVLQDVGKKQLEKLLIYMYRGEVHVMQEDLPVFIKVAESLHVKGLAVPISENVYEQQPGKRCRDSQSVSLDETLHSGSSLCVATPQAHPYVHNVMTPSSHSQRLLQHFPQDERSIFQPRRSQEMEQTQYSVQNEVQTLNIMEHIHPSRENEIPLTVKHHIVNTQQLKRDQQQVSHSGEGYQMQSHSIRDHKLRMSHSEHNPTIPSSDSIIFNTTSDREFSKQPNISTAIEIQPDSTHDSCSRSDRYTDTEEKLCTDFKSGISNTSENKSIQNAVAGNFDRAKNSLKDTSVEHQAIQINSFRVSSVNGTFQNLVSEETIIKDEPEDCPMEDYENTLSISEDFENVKDSGISLTLKTATENDKCMETNDTNKSEGNNQESEERIPQPPTSNSPVKEAHINTQTGLPASQLRRELLRPIHQKAKPQSIPHPVIAPRESERLLREPPPLMKIDPKIPLQVSDTEKEKSPRVIRKDVQENAHSSHLLVKVPPTYHSQSSPPTHFSLHIHNQHLGSVVVNGGVPISQIPSNNNSRHTLPQNDGPLNLSGQKSPPEFTDEKVDQSDPFLGKIVTNRKKRLRGPKSWEFLVRLLKDPTTNPFLIRWENEESGVFRLVQPAAIAQRWGRRTGKHASECLSYENFARGLRYHYATGALQPVSERSFVYRFGPKALKALQQCDSASFPYL